MGWFASWEGMVVLWSWVLLILILDGTLVSGVGKWSLELSVVSLVREALELGVSVGFVKSCKPVVFL